MDLLVAGFMTSWVLAPEPIAVDVVLEGRVPAGYLSAGEGLARITTDGDAGASGFHAAGRQAHAPALRPQSQGAGVAGLSGPGPAGRSLLGNSATAIAGRCPLPHAWVAPGAGEISPAAGSPTSIQCKLWTAGRSAAKSTRQFRESSLRNRAGKAMGYNVAVVGATGNVGREMLSILNERQFPVQELYALASRRSLGVEVSFGESTLKCKDLASFDFSGIDFCLMSAGGSVSKEWSPKIAAKGAIVIDNSSAWR